jgi:uncharacterized delta-60 repeat protein
MKRTLTFSLILTATLIWISVSPAFAAALDPTFGTAGKSYAPGTDGFDVHGRSLIVQADGKFLVVGYNHQGQNVPSAQVVRYNSDGTVDTSFGANGVLDWGLQTAPMRVGGAVLQSDGKIVVVGTGSGSQLGIVVFRALSDGTLDPTFGTNGTVVKNIPGTTGPLGRTVLIQPSGKIVVGGAYHLSHDNYNVAFIRLNPDGTTDNSFGPNGNGIFLGDNGVSSGLVQAPDGSLVSSLTVETDTFYEGWYGDMRAIRLSADGILDTGFGTNGYASLDFGYGEHALGVAVQPDGKMVLVGGGKYQSYSDVPYRGDWVIGRLNSNGSVDSSFGANGRVRINFKYRSFETANTVLLEPSGNILVAGEVIVRLSPNGTILGKTDPSSLHDPTRFVSTIYALARQPDGKILAAGEDPHAYYVGLARYLDITSINNTTPKYDFDGDGISEISVYSAGSTAGADSYWSGAYSENIGLDHTFNQRYGIGQDIQVPGDYDGDRRTDYAVFRPSDGNWYSTTQPDGDLNTHFTSTHWGQAGDFPAPADFDGDGVTDRAVFRPANGAWYILNSGGGVTALQFGTSGDKPVPADYDNDGRADIAVVRDTGGNLVWYILQSSDNSVIGFSFGLTGDRAVPTDYDTDGRAEITVFRAGVWYMLRNYTTVRAGYWGLSGDIPAPADYDGDGIVDLAVYRPSSLVYYILRSRDGLTQYRFFNSSSDRPVASAPVR